MLRNGAALIQQKLQRVVVCPHHKGAGPEVWPPMAHRFDQPNELPLIGGQLGVLRCDGAAVEGNGATVLMENGTKIGAKRVAVVDEGGIEVRQLECRASDQGLLEGVEGLVGSRVPSEGLLFQ
jgi:hypothetical protein